jgi:hypothetical protein
VIAMSVEKSPAPRPAAVQPAVAPFQNSTAGNSVRSNGFSDRRREFRYATCDEVRLSLNGMAGSEIPAVLRDVSRGGLRVELAKPVQTGARMKISIRDRAIVFAVARYCHRTSDKYQVGASIENVYYPAAAERASRYAFASEPASEGRDLARAIIDDHTSSSFGRLSRLADLSRLPD